MRQLTSYDLDELESRLRGERGTVLEAICTRLSGDDGEQQRVLVNYFSEGDVAAAAGLFSGPDIAMLRAELAQLDAIDAAIKRFDFGVGGRCIVCDNAIALARLRAQPTALTCADCQRRIDAGRGADGGIGPARAPA